MRPRRMLAAIFLLTVGLSIFLTGNAMPGQKQTQNRAKKTLSQSATKTTVTEQDRQVLEALLLNLLTYGKWGDSPGYYRGDLQIIVSPTTSGHPNFSVSDWKTSVGREIPADLWADWGRRNQMSVSLKQVKFVSKQIRVQETGLSGYEWGKAFSKAFPKAVGNYDITLPGYSSDGRRAIVSFHEGLPGPEFMSESAGLHLLVKNKGQWKVTKRYIQMGE